ncbi:MAG: PHP domain-containing protein [Rhodothermales bacterium]|nr:PHP domain-containing protein [Rhodothermales bacterium]
MNNKTIARFLKETSALIDLTGGNIFRARAMENAARTIERLDAAAIDLLQAGTLTNVKGIGDGLAAQIKELVQTGSFEVRDELLGAIPPGVLDMMRIKGLGAKKVRAIWQQLEITSIAGLEEACLIGRLADLDGFGAKTQENILENIRLLKQYSAQRRYADAVVQATPLIEGLRAQFAQVEPAGVFRRKCETVDRVDLVAVADSADVLLSAASVFLTDAVVAEGSRVTGTLPDGLAVAIHQAAADRFGAFWLEQTGSEEHLADLRSLLGKIPPEADEAAIYARAGLAWVPPELREGRGEIEAAATRLPKLIVHEDLKGSLHNHSRYSDGANSLEEMAEATRALGLSYFGICDHSQSLVIANGMPPERVAQQQEEIRRLNAGYAAQDIKFRIFSGIESDILLDGSLDYPEEILASFDFVVASVHSGLTMPEAEATARLLRAIDNPYTTILGHPTGRLLLVREGYFLDYSRILDACAERGVAIELNANPYRLDLDWRWIKEATDRGILISINPDAHTREGLLDTRWGVEAARKGWLEASMCLNALSLDAFAAWLAVPRKKRTRP